MEYKEITHLLDSKKRKILTSLAKGLRLVRKEFKQVNEIAVVSGFLLDLIQDNQPKDIDIIFNEKQVTSRVALHLDKKIYNFLKTSGIEVYSTYSIDVFNATERLLKDVPLKDQVIGHLSDHTFYHSQLFLDSNGKLWTNQKAAYYIQNRILELNYSGLFVWFFIKKLSIPKDIVTKAVTLRVFIRGIDHIDRKQLKAGEGYLKFSRVVANAVLQKGFLSDKLALSVKEFIEKHSLENKLLDLIDKLEIEDFYKTKLKKGFKKVLE